MATITPARQRGKATGRGSSPQVIRSIITDPQALVQHFTQGGGRRKIYPLPMLTMDRVARQCPQLAAIIGTRIGQVASFCRIPRDKYDAGFKVRLKDPDAKPGEGDKDRIKEATEFMLRMVRPDFKDDRLIQGVHYPVGGLEAVTRALVADRLTYDAFVFEKRRSHDDSLFSIFPLDPKTIMPLTRPEETQLTEQGAGVFQWLPNAERQDRPLARYVQSLEPIGGYLGQPEQYVYFSDHDIHYGIANPTSDIRRRYYGESEIERMITVVTGMLNAMEFNNRQFTQGALVPGVFAMFGDFDQSDVQEFKRQWRAQVSGVENAWRVPVIASSNKEGKGGIQFQRLKDSASDMQFDRWMEMLWTVACAVYQIDPAEVNLKTSTSSGSQPLFDRNRLSEIKASKDKGLIPLLTFVMHQYTEGIVKELGFENLEFAWQGHDTLGSKERAELDEIKIRTGTRTINDVLTEQDLPRIEEAWADAPGNATLMQAWMIEMGDKFGGGGMGGGGGGAPGGPGGAPGGGSMPPPGQKGGPPGADDMTGQARALIADLGGFGGEEEDEEQVRQVRKAMEDQAALRSLEELRKSLQSNRRPRVPRLVEHQQTFGHEG